MRVEYFFPLYLMLGNLGAAVVYLCQGKRVVAWYWLSALSLNVAIFIMARSAGK